MYCNWRIDIIINVDYIYTESYLIYVIYIKSKLAHCVMTQPLLAKQNYTLLAELRRAYTYSELYLRNI